MQSARATNMPSSGAAASDAAAEPASDFTHLHGDLLRRCLQPLTHRDLLTVSAVCREWQEASHCELLWSERYVVSAAGRQAPSLWPKEGLGVCRRRRR